MLLDIVLFDMVLFDVVLLNMVLFDIVLLLDMVLLDNVVLDCGVADVHRSSFFGTRLDVRGSKVRNERNASSPDKQMIGGMKDNRGPSNPLWYDPQASPRSAQPVPLLNHLPPVVID